MELSSSVTPLERPSSRRKPCPNAMTSTSVDSPSRLNTSTCSNTGVTIRSKPKRRARSAKAATTSIQRAESGGRMSCVPTGERYASEASCGTAASYRSPCRRLRPLCARFPWQHPVRVVHRVDPLHRTEDRLEVARVGELEVESQLGDA